MKQQLPIVLDERTSQMVTAGDATRAIACERTSLAGSVSQRACVFCGSRVVLYPIADALHLVHGPIGCATYTWDIRGALSSGPQLHRSSFCTDLREGDIIHGGEAKLARALDQLIDRFAPRAAFATPPASRASSATISKRCAKRCPCSKASRLSRSGPRGFAARKKTAIALPAMRSCASSAPAVPLQTLRGASISSATSTLPEKTDSFAGISPGWE